MPSRVVDELPIAWVVHGLDRHDLLHEPRGVLTDVLDQFGLLVGRARDKDDPRIRHRARDPLEKVVILGRVSAADALRLLV